MTDFHTQFTPAGPGVKADTIVEINVVEHGETVHQLILTRDQAEALWRDLSGMLQGKIPAFRYGDHIVAADGREVRLTQQESDLVAICARHRGHVSTYETIIRGLWPYDAEREGGMDRQKQIRLIVHNANIKMEPVGIQLAVIHGLGVTIVGNLRIEWRVR